MKEGINKITQHPLQRQARCLYAVEHRVMIYIEEVKVEIGKGIGDFWDPANVSCLTWWLVTQVC